MFYFVFGILFVYISYLVNIPFMPGGFLIPDFIGYTIIALGLRQFKNKGKHFENFLYPTYAMIGFSILYYVTMLTKITVNQYFITRLMELIINFGPLYIVYGVISGIKDLEVIDQVHLDSDKLITFWFYLLIVDTVGYFSSMSSLTSLTNLASLVLFIFLIYYFYQSAKTYNTKIGSGE